MPQIGRLARVRRLWLALRRPAKRSSLRIQVFGAFDAWVALCTLLLVAAAFIVADPIVLLIKDDWPDPVRGFFATITDLGDSAIWLVPSGIVLIALIFHGPVKKRSHDLIVERVLARLSFFFVAVAGSGLLITVGKRLIGRVRPNHVGEALHLHFEPLGWSASAASFPSGHSTTAFAVATALVLLFGRRWAPLAFAVAALVAASRVVVGAHFVSDAIAGAWFGAAFTLVLARTLARRGIVFRADSSGWLQLRRIIADRPLAG